MCILKLCLTREKRALSGDVRLCLSVANITLRLFSAESAAVNVVCLLLGAQRLIISTYRTDTLVYNVLSLNRV